MNTNRSAQGFKSPTAFGGLSSRALFVVALFALVCGEALAQEAAAQKQQTDGTPSAPPPMRYIPDDVRRRLEAERDDPKARTRLSLELAEERLARVAEQANAAASLRRDSAKRPHASSNSNSHEQAEQHRDSRSPHNSPPSLAPLLRLRDGAAARAPDGRGGRTRPRQSGTRQAHGGLHQGRRASPARCHQPRRGREAVC